MDGNNDKKEYLIKTLSRTKRKDYENYVVNRIWNKLDDLEIKPMTQKYVKRPNGWALIDLYFPQFNIGIECDEKYHLTQQEQDKIRCEDIIKEISNNGERYDELRIDVENNSFDKINVKIDEIVNHIKQAKEKAIRENKFHKWEIIEPKKYFENKDKITIDDDVEFSTIQEVVDATFKQEHIPARKCYFKIKNLEKTYVWFPHLTLEGNFYSGWKNTLSDDGTKIVQKPEKNEPVKMDNITRVVFMKIKDKITGEKKCKFVGVFEQSGVDTKNNEAIFKRTATEWKFK